jgi:predicted nucleic acid-binding Zn ribbon protein
MKCAHCGKPITAKSPSEDFCGESCSRLWQAEQTGPAVTTSLWSFPDLAASTQRAA